MNDILRAMRERALTDAAFRRVWKKYTVFPLLAFLFALPLPQKL